MKTTLKRLLEIALVLTLALSTAILALADGEVYTIQIKPGTHTATDNATRFTAYQIFKGELGTYTTDSDNDPEDNSLGDVEWGSGIDAAGLVEDLLNDEDVGEALQGVLADYIDVEDEAWSLKDGKSFETSAVALLIAQWLDENDTQVKLFAKYVAANVDEGEGTDSTKEDTTKATNWKIEIDTQDAGYYLIVDNDGSKDAVSEYILGVFGSQIINIKSDAPTSGKEVLGDTTVGVGDKITYLLEGTLPENYGEYATYTYIFHDNLSEGLDFNADDVAGVKVYVKNGNNVYLISSADYRVTPNATHTKGEGDNVTTTTCSMDIGFENLKLVKKGTPVSGESADKWAPADDAEATDITIDKDTKINVVYTATLNAKAVAGEPIDNKANLEYSNNPNTDGSGTTENTTETPEEEATVYTFGLEITKKGGEDLLPGAGFVLTRSITETVEGEEVTKTQYATFTADADGKLTLAGWTTLADNAMVPKTEPTTETAGTLLTTGEDGKFLINGLSDGIYTLTEVVTPKDFNTMAPVVFEITAEVTKNANGESELTKLEASAAGREDVQIPEDANEDNTTTGIVHMTLINAPASVLPGTGGIGSTIFYIAGSLLLVIAGAYLFFSGRKARKSEK